MNRSHFHSAMLFANKAAETRSFYRAVPSCARDCTTARYPLGRVDEVSELPSTV